MDNEPAVISGRTTNMSGLPEASVVVGIHALGVRTTSAADGTYNLVVPASLLKAGREVSLSAWRQGLASQTRMLWLSPGAAITENFQLAADVLGL